MFKGTGVALVTSFKADLSVDYDGLAKLLEHTGPGVDYYVVQGTTGESVTTTKEEKSSLVSFVREHNNRNLPIIYGIGGNNTGSIIQSINETDFDGIAGLLSVSPYYNKPSQEGIYQHFIMVADASPVPVILYNVPGRTSSNISAETTLRLSAHKNIVGIKEASGDLSQCQIISRDMPDGFSLISGDDILTLPLLSIGGSGVISVLANAYPDIFKNIYQSFVNKNVKESWLASKRLLEINPLMYAEGNPVGVKEVLSQMGICESYVRLPHVQASKSLREKVKQAMSRI